MTDGWLYIKLIKDKYVFPQAGILAQQFLEECFYQNTDMYKVKPPQVSGIINGGQYFSPWWLTMLESNNKAKNI